MWTMTPMMSEVRFRTALDTAATLRMHGMAWDAMRW
jgi:hypothetical protein